MKPTIALIAAMTPDRVIGRDNKMPWHLPADLKYFKRVTFGKPVIMGRKTYESIGKALPGRENIVITRNTEYSLPDAYVVNNLDDALARVSEHPEVMIIGGAQIYQQTLAMAHKLYLTMIQTQAEGDAHFPAWNDDEWQITERTQGVRDEKNSLNYEFVTLERT